MVDSEKIKKKMDEKGISQGDLAKVLCCSQSTVCLKINNKRPFFLDEACQVAKLLNIEEAFFDYFFANGVA